jgi:predicted nucleic acid-binding protein
VEIIVQLPLILIDERVTYKIAKSIGLNPIGTLAILIEAKRRGLIKELRPLLEEMINKGRWYSRFVIEKALKTVEEF